MLPPWAEYSDAGELARAPKMRALADGLILKVWHRTHIGPTAPIMQGAGAGGERGLLVKMSLYPEL